ncbi:LCP family protein [Candidatus Peregrinibacteria bacterium]|jgi:polyisoprenyl-teichoic acid--peptidoglycan teichoic acid transferase|nr:LCP family protein [Candidatus Peregrinibacteria bacterium]MBT4632071.1 LCP family protein [Candidatus Peregrinibacteria bacterium]MBT5516304.1 LCP family protein [Candidatus Peregrinibacteria bacterium]MBT5823725.1 LCP family protein [Candidatus Peregrinibacteria bacterium]
MNGFQKREINTWNKKAERWIKSHLVLAIIALLLGLLTLKGVVGAIKVGEPFSVKQIVVSAVSKSLTTDQNGNTNILLLGVGGEGHDGQNLTDTMIIASIDRKKNLVPMLSIPRDIYVENDIVGWGTRINSIYEFILDEHEDHELAMDQLIKEVENLSDMEIHYYAKIDFQGVTDVIDALGGIEVTVEEDIYDPYYPDDYTYEFNTFSLSAGTQIMDGDTALKYARSRYTTSDFDRAKRQHQIIDAFRARALSIGFLLNPNKIKNTYYAISNNFQTDLTLTDMLNLASMAPDFNSDSLISQVFHDDASQTGGFLYTPDREDYGGAFVLTPYSENFDELQIFSQLYFYHPEILMDQIPIQVVNGTKEEGLAGLTKMQLNRYGFNPVGFGNAVSTDQKKSRIIIRNELRDGEFEETDISETLELLPTFIPGADIYKTAPEEYNELNWPTEARIIVELGEDFLEYYQEYEERFYWGIY